jgi:hypothetical protein
LQLLWLIASVTLDFTFFGFFLFSTFIFNFKQQDKIELGKENTTNWKMKENLAK